jgi:carbon monoxide dehydrogenase subunit G
MKVTGTSMLAADPKTVWQALNDPAVLAQAIPGCRRLEALGDDVYAMTVAAGVGSIKGVYDGQVRLSDQQEPDSFQLHAQGAGAAGTVGADVQVTLTDAPDGGTSLSYDADATVGGVIGGVGQRMLVGVSKKLASEFFANVDAAIGGSLVASGVGTAERAEPKPSGVASLRLPPDPSTVSARSAVPTPGGSVTTGGRVPSASAAAGVVYTPAVQARGGRLAGSAGFAAGVAVGAVAALAGAVVGAWIGRRRD